MSVIDRLSDLAAGVPALGMRVDGSPPAGHDWEEVAGALAQLTGPGCELLRGMYCHDARALRSALARLNGAGLLALADGQVEGVADPDVGRVALAAMQVFVSRGQCAKCAGRGWLMEGELRVTCLDCGGEGHVKPHVAMVLRAAGVERTDGAFVLFQLLLDRLEAWHGQGWATLSRQLSERASDG